MADESVLSAGRQLLPANTYGCFEFTGPLSIDSLGKAINSLVRRHAVFRTMLVSNHTVSALERRARMKVFESKGIGVPGLYYQVARSDAKSVDLWIIDGCRGDGDGIDIPADLTARFDYTELPLLRAGLLRHSPEHHTLLLAAPAIICDPWSWNVVYRDIVALYDASCGGRQLPPPAHDYRSFVQWQYKTAYRGGFESEIRHWCAFAAEIEKSTPQLPRSTFETALLALGTAQIERFQFTSIESEHFCQFANQAGAQLRSLFLTAFTRWVMYATKRRTISVSTDFLNRRLPEHKDIVGWLSNSHLLKIEFPEGATCVGALRRVGEILQVSERNAAVPQTFAWSRLGRVPPTVTPGLSYGFISAKGQAPLRGYGGVAVQPSQIPPLSGRLLAGLNLLVVEKNEGILLAIHYTQAQFPAIAIKEVLSGVANIADWIAYHPKEPFNKAPV